MARKTAKDFDQRILDLFDGYVHGKRTKREFLEAAGKYTAGAAGALAVLNSLKPDYALANQVAPDDPAIATQRLTYPSPEGHGEVEALWAQPAAMDGPGPAVLVIHENRGLNPYIEDVARRLAKAGFVALAPDGLSPMGGYPGNDDEGREMQRSMDRGKLLADFFAAFDFLLADANTTKVGAVGFCFGGGVVNALAVGRPELAAGVPYYGRQADAADAPSIQAPLLIHYAEMDERINQGWPAYREALDKAGKTYEVHFYPGTNHGFHNDTTPRFDEAAAALSWERTLAFFEERLRDA